MAYDMNRIAITILSIFFCITFISCAEQKDGDNLILLHNGWSIQSTSQVPTGGSTLSDVSYEPQNWYPVSVPSTVLAGLVENGLYPDPYYGTNIESIPGYTSQRRGEMPDDSPFRVAWWYRTEFRLPFSYRGKTIWISFQSINYRANIWMNGKLVADTTVVEGAYRTFDFDITSFVQTGKANCLALEIFPPRSNDLSITWVDWNPTPPDRGMGIWYDVSVHATGPVAIRTSHIITDLNLPSTDTAKLSVSAELFNASPNPIAGTLSGKTDKLTFSRPVSLAPGETRLVSFTPDEFPQLAVANPRLWWPNNAGPQNLYELTIQFETGGKISDRKNRKFGIREISS